MSYQLRVILVGVLAVIVFDAIAALASRRFGFAYAKATVGSALIYGTIGFLAARGSDASPLQSAAFAAGIVGFVDASAGWGVSWIIGPGRLPGGTAMTLERWLGAAVFVVALACAIGVFGGVIGRQAGSVVAVPGRRISRVVDAHFISGIRRTDVGYGRVSRNAIDLVRPEILRSEACTAV